MVNDCLERRKTKTFSVFLNHLERKWEGYFPVWFKLLSNLFLNTSILAF